MLKILKGASSETTLKDLEEDEEGDLDESEEEERKRSRKGRKSAGRKSPWTQQQINDLIDIIVESKEYKKNLIFRKKSFKGMGSCKGKLNET